MSSVQNVDDTTHHITLPPVQAALVPFPPSCPVMAVMRGGGLGVADKTDDDDEKNNNNNNNNNNAAATTTIIVGKVESVFIDLSSTNREYNYRVRPLTKDSTGTTTFDTCTNSTDGLLVVTEPNLQYAPNCTVAVDPSSLPPFITQHDGAAGGQTGSNESHRRPNNRRDAEIISSIASAASANKMHYFVDVLPGPNDQWKKMHCTVPSTALLYRPVVGQDSTDDEPDVSFVETRNDETKSKNEEDGKDCCGEQRAPPSMEITCTSTATNRGDGAAPEDKVQVISPLPPTTASSDQTNHGSDDDPTAPSAALPSATSAPAAKDKNTKDLSGQKRPRDPNEVVSVEDVVRRIEIAEVLDPRVVQNALIGPDRKINHKMQDKLGVAIYVLGLGIPDAGSNHDLEQFANLGVGVSPKDGDKCVMICGEKRKVHEASKVVVHILVDKCYTGGCDSKKDNLRKELRIVRQVRKKVELPQTTTHPTVSSGVPSVPTSTSFDRHTCSPMLEGIETKREDDSHQIATKRPATINAVEKVREESGWSPSPEESYYGPASLIPSTELQRNPTVNCAPATVAPVLKGLEEESPSQLQLIMLPPQFNGDSWMAKVRSPSKLDFFSLFDTIVPTNIKSTFGKMRVCLLGGTAHSDQDKDLPLHVHLEGSEMLSVGLAAEYVASLLVSKTQQQHEQHAHFEGESHFDGKEWVAHVVSPVGINELFAIVVGPGAEIKKRLISKFARCYIRLVDGAAGEPPSVVVKHQDRSVVEAAAAHITTMITDRYQKAGSSEIRPMSPLGLGMYDSRSPMHLVAGPIFKDERSGHWTNMVDSPIGQNDLFVMFVGRDAQRKRDFEETFGCNLWIENIGTEVSRGPLQLKITAKSASTLQIATERAAHMLYEAARKKGETQMIRNLIMDEYVHGENGWAAVIRSPVDPDTLFDATIRNGKKADIIARFGGNCFISIRGDGVKDHLGRNSGGPLRVMVGHECDRAAGEAAVWHVAELLYRAAAGY